MSTCGRNRAPTKPSQRWTQTFTPYPQHVRWPRFLAKSQPTATFFVLWKDSTKNVQGSWGQIDLVLRPSKNVTDMVSTLCQQSVSNVAS